MTVPLVIDTDTAQDDRIALLVGLLDPLAELRAITMVAGNVGFDQQVRPSWGVHRVRHRLAEQVVGEAGRRGVVEEFASAMAERGMPAHVIQHLSSGPNFVPAHLLIRP